MKTKNTNTKTTPNTGLANRPEQVGTDKLPKINLKARFANRALEADKLLDILKKEAPDFYQLAEVVGKWVWISFADKQPYTVTRLLSEFGFHWSTTRQAWQHPGGTIPVERATYEPRARYGSYFPARQTA